MSTIAKQKFVDPLVSSMKKEKRVSINKIEKKRSLLQGSQYYTKDHFDLIRGMKYFGIIRFWCIVSGLNEFMICSENYNIS